MAFVVKLSPTMSQGNKDVIRRLIEESLNKGNLDVVDELVSPDFVAQVGLPKKVDREEYKEALARRRAVIPDVEYTIEDMIAEGDKVVTLMTARGTQKGELYGIPPTGKHVTLKQVIMFRIKDGKIVERCWGLSSISQ